MSLVTVGWVPFLDIRTSSLRMKIKTNKSYPKSFQSHANSPEGPLYGGAAPFQYSDHREKTRNSYVGKEQLKKPLERWAGNREHHTDVEEELSATRISLRCHLSSTSSFPVLPPIPPIPHCCGSNVLALHQVDGTCDHPPEAQGMQPASTARGGLQEGACALGVRPRGPWRSSLEFCGHQSTPGQYFNCTFSSPLGGMLLSPRQGRQTHRVLRSCTTRLFTLQILPLLDLEAVGVTWDCFCCCCFQTPEFPGCCIPWCTWSPQWW